MHKKYPRKQSRKSTNIIVKSTFTIKRYDLTSWSGWGYNDSYFYTENGALRFAGNRYEICQRTMPYFRQWATEELKVDWPEDFYPERPKLPEAHEYPESRMSASQIAALRQALAGDVRFSVDGADRFVRSHAQFTTELDRLLGDATHRRIPDAVAWPECHEDVVEIVRACHEHDVVVVPVGGATSVSDSVACPPHERRAVLSLDTTRMNEILWLDEEDLVVCCESGIVGQDLERELRALGYTCGHEPDSIEFSTLGGWVATRASGMKKNAYGNIEDIVVHARLATPRGVLERGDRAPRASCGPDLQQLALGSEGCLGVVTEVCLKIRPLPAATRYGSLVFPDFASGFRFVREVARRRAQPASVRLMDNDQMRMGKGMRDEMGAWQSWVDGVKAWYLTKWRGFDPKRMAYATLLYEGADEEEVARHERTIAAIAAEHGGVSAGQTNGKNGYNMTFAIAYARDFGVRLGVHSDSRETAVPWSRALGLIDAVKRRIADEAKRLGLPAAVATCRIAQTYDAGCCVYVYVMANANGVDDPTSAIEQLGAATTDEIVANGGAISHHHGVGKARVPWYERCVSKVGVDLFKACKKHLDPKNIFAVGNLAGDMRPQSKM